MENAILMLLLCSAGFLTFVVMAWMFEHPLGGLADRLIEWIRNN